MGLRCQAAAGPTLFVDDMTEPDRQFMSRTRVVYIAVALPYNGATEEFFEPEVEELLCSGVDLLLAPRSLNGRLDQEKWGRLQCHFALAPLCSLSVLAVAVTEAVRRPVRTLSALILLRHSRTLGIFMKNLAVFPKALWVARIARRWGADHIHAQWATTTGTMALIASEVTGIPWSMTLHRGDIVEDNLLQEKLTRSRFSRFISESGIRLACSICAETPAASMGVIHMGIRIPPQSTAVKTSNHEKVILCPAFLIDVKGHTYLLRALAQLKQEGCNLRTLIAGKGPLRGALEKEADELGIRDRVQFLGQVPREEILAFYEEGRVDMVVLPSVDLGDGLHEGIPVSLMEAMSYGVPVISTKTGGIAELLSDGAGVMVPEKDPASLARAIRRVMEDETLRRQLSCEGRKRVAEHFDARKAAALLHEVFTGRR